MNLTKVLRITKAILTDKRKRFLYFAAAGFYNNMSDEEYLKKRYFALMGVELNLDNPMTFNEKLQWLKLYDRKPEYTNMVDKYEAKKCAAEAIGEEYIIPTLGVWDKFDDIDFDTLPNQFVLKCTHDSGGLVIVTDKRKLNKKAAKKKIEKSLKRNYYYVCREWPYMDIKPKIIAEKYMMNNSDGSAELTDYKFFCTDGKVDNVMVCLERSTGKPKFYFFNQAWELLRINKRGKEAPEGFTIEKPKCMDEMFEIAAKLSKGLPFARIDLYECDEKVYFGEYTFFPAGGYDPNLLPETDRYFGSLIKCEK